MNESQPKQIGASTSGPATGRLSAHVRQALRGHCRRSVVAIGLAFLAQEAGAAPFPAEFDLSSLLTANGGDGSAGVVLNLTDGWYDTIGAVSSAGDVNGDGLDDLLVGSPGSSPNGRAHAGSTFVVFGRDGVSDPFPSEVELATLLSANGGDGSRGVVLNGIHPSDYSGFRDQAAAAGDVNGDGIGDLIVGARDADPGGLSFAGETYVVFGRDAGSGGFPAEIELSSLLPENGGDGSAGFVMQGLDSRNCLGNSVDGVGDVNGDGVDDLIVTAPCVPTHDPDGLGTGQSYVIFGRQSDHPFPALLSLASLLPENGGDGSAGFAINGVEAGDYAGGRAAGVGDVNGDGTDDLLISAYAAQPAGQAYVLFGRNVADVGPFDAEVELASLFPVNGGDGTAGFVVNGVYDDSFTGISIDGVGDFNSDGIADLIIGSEWANPGGRFHAGQGYVLFGRSTDINGFPPIVELSDLLAANGGDGSMGFALNGSETNDIAGDSVRGAGDLDDDGIADLMIGANFVDAAPGQEDAGATYVVFGHLSPFVPEFELSSLTAAGGGNGRTGVVFKGFEDEEHAGEQTTDAGDVNGDGVADIVISDREQRVWIVFGRSVFDTDTDGDGVNDAFDNCEEAANPGQRDTNGDGIGNVCDADLNGDCFVNFLDLGSMKALFFTGDPDADLDGDGNVNFRDLGLMKKQFFQAPGPSGVPNDCSP